MIKYGTGVDKSGNLYSSISKARLALESTQARLDTSLETNRRLEQSREEMGRKHGDLRLQLASLEEEVAQVRSRAREEKILLEARIEEVEELKTAAEDRIVKQEEIFKEKIESLKVRKKGEKSKSTDQRLISLETALAEAEDEKGALQLKVVELEDVAGKQDRVRVSLASVELYL